MTTPNSAGEVLNNYTYDIWGNTLTKNETVPNLFRYSGEYWDERSKLQYLRARWYDPSAGRFINEDTYEGELENPLSQNLYTYVHNNPLIYVDPTGHYCVSADQKYSHSGGCDGGQKGKEYHFDVNGSMYIPDSYYVASQHSWGTGFFG